MIRSFRHRGLKRLYERGDSSRIRPQSVDTLEEILALLDVAQGPRDMDVPGYRLHRLRGDRKDSWAIDVTGNWRVTFRFDGGDVRDVDFVDYH